MNCTLNLCHEAWEDIDPTPDVYSLLVAYNEKFFNNQITNVAIEWSKKMTSCAGITYHVAKGDENVVIIRLSEPLLKYSSRKDLVETLLVSSSLLQYKK